MFQDTLCNELAVFHAGGVEVVALEAKLEASQRLAAEATQALEASLGRQLAAACEQVTDFARGVSWRFDAL